MNQVFKAGKRASFLPGTKIQIPDFNHTPEPYDGPSYEKVLAARKKHVSPLNFHFYRNALIIVEGKYQYLYDQK